MFCWVVGYHAVCLQARHSQDPKIRLVCPRILKFNVLVQPNALLGARSNVVRTTQRGPRMLLGTDGLRSARAMPLLQQAVDPNLRPTHTVVKMADGAVAGGKKGFTLDVQLIVYFALWYLGNYYCTLIRPPHLPAAPSLHVGSLAVCERRECRA